jgi:4-hydroxybenzoate polyprenyltransferase
MRERGAQGPAAGDREPGKRSGPESPARSGVDSAAGPPSVPRDPTLPAAGPGRQARAALWIELSRPFTLVAPALGVVSGAITAAGAAPREAWSLELIVYPMLGSLMAATLNAGNNALNQIYDLEIDRINKPKRPLPSGRLGVRDAWIFTLVTYIVALVLAWVVAPGGRHECFWIVIAAVIATFAYSCPPLRTKQRGIWANITIAIPRGVLLKVAGWSCVKTVLGFEPWYIGTIFGLFLLGASTTKDFADMEGDRRGGCRTLPIVYGVRTAAWMISPSFVLPFVVISIGAFTGVLTGNHLLLQLLAVGMTMYGAYVCYLMLRRPEELAVDENHVSWAHMYRMMFVAQIGFAVAYLF